MHEARTFFTDLALVFLVATAAMLVMQRLRQPAVLGYLVAGIIVGPHVPVPLFADPERIESLAELGVILVMFSIGLEFSLERVGKLLPTSGLVALVQITGMIWLGFAVGSLAGWEWPANLFLGGMVAISSTMIISRVFTDQRVEPELSDSVFGILVVQDLAVVVLIALFTAVATGSGLPPAEIARVVGSLAAFVAALVVVGLLVVPRVVKEADRRGASEVLLVASVGICFGFALLAEHFGYSVALGAFVAGMLVGESGRRVVVEHLVAPLRDVFAAVFFVSVGMLVDPRAIAGNLGLIVALTCVVLVGMTTFLSLGSFLVGKSVRLSIRTGMSLAQIGEFSFIIVAIGVTAGAVTGDLYAIAVGVAVITTFLTPMLVRGSERVAVAVSQRLPKPVQTFAVLYGTWIESLGGGRRTGRRSRVERRAIVFALDALALMALGVGAGLAWRWLVATLGARLGLGPEWAVALVVGALILVAAPFVVGVVRLARALGADLARRALPDAEPGAADLASAPRRSFEVALQIGLVALAAFPVIAVTQVLLPLSAGVLVLVVLVLGFSVTFWRSTSNLQDHVRAGAEMVLEALSRQRQTDSSHSALPALAEILPGMGPLVSRTLEPGHSAVGKTLAELHLRALSGASVLAIERASGGVVAPSGDERLAAGDILSLTGSETAIERADRILRQGDGGIPEELADVPG